MKKSFIIIIFILSVFILSCEYYAKKLIGPDTPQGPALVVKNGNMIIDHGGDFVFEDVTIGESKQVTLTLENIGTETLNVTSVHTNSSDEFLIESGDTTVDLEPGEGNDIIVKFSPNSFGTYEGLLTIESNDPANEGIYEINLMVNGVDKSWEVSQTLSNHIDDVSSVAFSSNGDTLVSGSFDDKVIIWKWVNNQWEFDEELNNSDDVYSVDISNNNQIICGIVNGETINWYHDGSSWVSYSYNQHTMAVLSLDILSDGTKFVSGSADNMIIVWEWETSNWSNNYTLTDHNNLVNTVAFNSDGTEIVSGGMDNKIIVYAYNEVTSSWAISFSNINEHASAVKRAVFSSDDNKIVSCGTDKVIVWKRDAVDGWTVESTLNISGVVVNSVDISPTGLTIVAGLADNRVLIYEWDDNVSEWLLKYDIGGEHSNDVLCVDFDLYGGSFATASKDKSVKIWN